MKVRLSLISLVLIVALLVPVGVQAKGIGIVNVSEKDAGRTVDLDANSLLVLNLQANPSTGYSWQVQNVDQKVLSLAGDSEFKSQSQLLGAPATQVMRFKGISAGQTTIQLVYRRPWDTDERSKTFSIQVRSKGAYTGNWKPAAVEPVSVQADNSVSAVPTSFNWCTNTPNGCTPVKNQGSCGSCWAFGTVAPFEGNIKIKDSLTKDLSEQYLVSCNSDGWGCNGGWWAHDYHEFKYISGESGAGAVYEADMPYRAADDPCNAPHTHHEKISDWAYVGNSSSVPAASSIKQAIYDHGPLSVAVYVGSAFQSYSGGIFNTHESGSPNHAVVLVGWDDTAATPHWIMRNSWGTGWGESGYMRIAYGISQIGYAASYVVYNGTTPTPSPTPGSGGGEQIVNGGFESGTTPWVQYSSGGYQLIDDYRPHTGTYGVWMGGYNNANEYIYQTITIPSSGNLTYWWYMTSSESTVYAYDYMYVKLYNTSGGLVATLRTRSNTAARGAWYQDTISLSSYAGQTLRMHFSVTTDSSVTTNFWVDDVSVQ
jgi:inhibitor of cysteine peptidase